LGLGVGVPSHQDAARLIILFVFPKIKFTL
jgi:hypothetical protein